MWNGLDYQNDPVGQGLFKVTPFGRCVYVVSSGGPGHAGYFGAVPSGLSYFAYCQIARVALGANRDEGIDVCTVTSIWRRHFRSNYERTVHAS